MITLERVREDAPQFLPKIDLEAERARLIALMKTNFPDWDGDINIHDSYRYALEVMAQTRFLNVEGFNAGALQNFTAFAEGAALDVKIEGDYGVERMTAESDLEYRKRGPVVYAATGSSGFAEVTLRGAALRVDGVKDAYVQVLTNSVNAIVYTLARYERTPPAGGKKGDPDTAMLAAVQTNLEPPPIGSTTTAAAPTNTGFTIAGTLSYVSIPTLTDATVEAASREKLYRYLDEIFLLNQDVRVSQLIAALDTDFTADVAITTPANDLIAPDPSPSGPPTIFSVNRDTTDIVLTVQSL